MEAVKARNRGELSAYDKARAERSAGRKGAAEEEEDESEESEEEVKQKPKAKPTGAGGLEIENPNFVKRNEERDGVELTRKQREELERNAARRRYEELHKAGKTDEAKADLARLEEVKKRREEAAKKKEEEKAKAAQALADEKKKREGVRAGVTSELKDIMGTESKMPGSRSSATKKKDEKKEEAATGETGGRKIMNGVDESDVYNSYADTVSTKKVEHLDKPQAVAAKSIESCRAAEDDFM